MNTLEVKNLGVQELDSREMLEVDGGIIPLVIIGIALLAAGCSSQTNNNHGGSPTNVQGGDVYQDSSSNNSVHLDVPIVKSK